MFHTISSNYTHKDTRKKGDILGQIGTFWDILGQRGIEELLPDDRQGGTEEVGHDKSGSMVLPLW